MAFIENGKDSHLDRLAHDEIRERRTWYGKYYLPAAGVYMGFVGTCLFNRSYRRPMLAGIQRHIISAALLGGLFWYGDGVMLEQQQRKFAKLKHYIMLHPEDFPPYPPRLKVADTLQPWHPRRPGW